MLERTIKRAGEVRALRGSRPSRTLRLGALLVLLGLIALASVGQAFASGVTNANDDLRDGWYPEQPSLTPQLVSGGTFGQLWSKSVEGQVYAQPLLYNGTLLVATETDKVYGLDPATGALKWPAALNLGTPWKPADIACGDLTPNIGVTSTPVIDPSTSTAYLTHKTYASGTSGPARWYMDAINMETGTEKAGFPVELAGTAQNQPGVTFSPTTQLQRPGLLLMNGVVYAGFGSHCDFSPWQGWVFGVSTAGQVKARWVDLTPGLNGAGIWQSGSGLMSDGPGTLLLTTGNSHSPSTPAPGSSPPATLGDSAVRLAVQADGSLKAVDFFTPFDAEHLDATDADFGSGGVTGLNDQYFGTPSFPHLAVAVGKDGYVWLMNRDELGGFKQGPGGADKVVQRIGPYGGVWSRPGVWPGDGGWVYIPTASGGESAGGSTGFLRVYQYGVSGNGTPTLSLQATSSDAFGFTSSAAVITSDGTTSGSALVWMIWTPNGAGEGAQLRAYDPVPVGGHPVLRWSAPIGTSAKFATPGVGAGRIYVGTRDGHVLGFGSPITPLLTGSATSFPTTTIGSSSQKTVTLTATNTVTITKLTSSSTQFTIGTPSPALPAHLSAGQTIEVPVTFSPTQTGLIGGTLTAETESGNVSFALSGTGQAAVAQLTASPAVLSFGGTTVGGHLSGAAVFRNVGGAPLTINAVHLPAAPFSASGVPEVGSTIPAGGSVSVDVSFDPTAEGNFSDALQLESTGGNASVTLSATAGEAGVLQITSETNEFGAVAVGSTATRSFTVKNIGGIPVTITKSKPPSGGAFAPTTTLSEGSTIAPGATVTETVAFTPSAPGYASAHWLLNGNDTTGLHEIAFTGTGTVPAPGAAWSHNGSATIISPNGIRTTPATSNLAGSGFFTTPIESRHLIVEFDQTIGSGTGADGQTLTFADASKAAPSALGAAGGGLGFSGIPGIAVAFDTYKNSVNPSANFVGITDGPTSPTTLDLLHWLSTSSAIPNLRSGVHHVKVETLNGTITVWIDGAQALSATAAFAPKVLLGFTGGTGGKNDLHQVENVVVSGDAPPTEPPPASLRVSEVVNAPSGSPQASTKLVVSGSCPSSFTTAALGNGESATPTLTGAVAGQSCSVSQAAPSGSGWSTTASVNGGAQVALTPSGGQVAVPSFLLVGGVNTVQFTNTYTEPPPPASLRVSEVVNAPSGSPQASTKLVVSGSCPSSFTTAALGNGESATPTLTGAVAGQSCSVSQAAPSGSGWSTTASVNGGAQVALTPSGGQVAVPSFLLVGGVNTVQFTNTYTEPAAASLTVSSVVNAPSGSPQASTKLVVSGSCPSSFTTAALGNGESATPTLTGAVAGASCSVSEAAPSGSGWKTTASVNGGAEVALTASGGQLTVPSFLLVGGVNTVKFTNTYTEPTGSLIPDPTAGGWQLNGSSALTATELALTAATSHQAGSAFWPKAVDSRNLTIEFEATIGGGSGADGLTMTIGDSSRGALPTSRGTEGGGLGFSGIPGLAVALDEYKNSVNPSSNFVGLTDGPTSSSTPDLLHWLATANLALPLQNATHRVKVVTTGTTITVFVDSNQMLSQTVTLPTSAYLGFTGGTGGLNNRHAISKLTVSNGTEPPPPASLRVSEVVNAPSGSPQASTKLVVSGSCPSSFTTAALGNGESATPTLTGAVAGQSCSVSQAAPSGSGWSTTASVNGGAQVALTPSGGQVAVPSFLLVGGVNTVQFTNTYTEPAAASLTVSSVVNAPSGSPQASTKLVVSGSCPSSFTTAALGNGESATPTLTGAVAGASCSVSEAAPSGSGWKTTASVNGGAEVALTASGGQLTVPSFLLVGGVNTVKFTNTYTEPTGSLIPDPTAGGWQLNGSSALTATELALTAATSHQAGSAFWPKAVDSRNLTIEFEATIGGGSGADGLTMTIGDSSRGALPTSRGTEGGGLGFSGIPGLAVALDEYKNSVNPSSNFVGLTDGPTSSSTPDLLHWLATANLALPLQNATHRVKVVTTGTTITVFVDSNQMLSQTVTLPTSAYLGFTGGTGGLNNRHAISKLTVTSP